IFGKGEPNQTVLSSRGSVDIFVARYNPDGMLAWAKSAGWSGSDFVHEITALSDDSTIVAGRFVASGTGEGDIFIARYDPDGTPIWAKGWGSSLLDEGCGITVLSDDSTVVTGYFDELAVFGEGESNETLLISEGVIDIFIARFSP
ncbi:MAG: hypothetical protein NTY09_07680, partial [bacterium]|nr:hypothetical protein [bacterium]